jgi:hypothetical protein
MFWKTIAIRGGVMRKTLTALLAAASLGIAAVPSLPSPAEARWGWGGFGVGLATGAIIGGALARPYYPYYPYYGYYGGYYAPAYYYPPYYGYGYYPRY